MSLLQLEQSVRCVGNVEVWLGELLAQQMKALHSIIRLAAQFINDQEFQLLAFLNEAIAQVALIGLYHAANVIEFISKSIFVSHKRNATRK